MILVLTLGVTTMTPQGGTGVLGHRVTIDQDMNSLVLVTTLNHIGTKQAVDSTLDSLRTIVTRVGVFPGTVRAKKGL